jgi:hypothetical protein
LPQHGEFLEWTSEIGKLSAKDSLLRDSFTFILVANGIFEKNCKQADLRRRGVVVIVSANGTEDRSFKSRWVKGF